MKSLSTRDLCDRLEIKPTSIRNWRRRFEDAPQPIEVTARDMRWSIKAPAEWKRFMKANGLTGHRT